MTDPIVPAEDPVVVAIDGPAGSGKSSVSKEVARASASATSTPVPPTARSPGTCSSAAPTRRTRHPCIDAASATSTTRSRSIPTSTGCGSARPTSPTRSASPRVTDAVSGVARVPAVREAVNALFRALVADVRRPGVVVEGRDITTVVAPDAPVRILLTAAPEVRAARRAASCTDAGRGRRGRRDRSERDASDSPVVDFLTPPTGVDVVDSTDLDFEQTVDAVLDVIGDA